MVTAEDLVEAVQGYLGSYDIERSAEAALLDISTELSLPSLDALADLIRLAACKGVEFFLAGFNEVVDRALGES